MMKNLLASHPVVRKALAGTVAVASLGAMTLAASVPAEAQFRGGHFGGGGGYLRPHFGGGFGGYRGYHGGYGGGYGRGYGRGLGYGLGGLGVGLALGGLYGGYGYGGYGGYYGAGYGGYGYGGCLRRVWGPYGPHLVNVCY